MARDLCDIGMIGLGVMGRNLVLNMADHGFSVAGYDKSASQVAALHQEGAGKDVRGSESIGQFIDMLARPRAVMILVPAGRAVDDVIHEILPFLGENDIIIDGGNSHYSDTERRHGELARRKIAFLGVGISGGEAGARYGPSIMPGGEPDAYERVRPILEGIAARVDGEPCAAWIGPGSAGHFVKMVHNGIEYAIMELIAETYDMLKRGLCYSNEQIRQVYEEWSRSGVQSYLVEITAQIFARKDDKTDGLLIDMILDEADQKGTGMWTTESTLTMHVPAPTIDMAVAMRDMSSYKNARMQAGQYLCGPQGPCPADGTETVGHLRNALEMGMILAYSQGMALLRTASGKFGYSLDLETIARIWRGGCIIRAAMLEDIRAAYRRRGDLPDLLADGAFVRKAEHLQEDLRRIVMRAAAAGIPVPGFSASLAYFDSYRSAWLPANLIQAQRDFFGSHTYRRVDRDGVFHTRWSLAGEAV